MNTNSPVLSKEERDILILAAPHTRGRHLSNSEIAQRLGISVSRVKNLIHQACLKLGAHNRNGVVIWAVIRGDILLNEVFSLNEQAEMFSGLSPDTLRRIANLVRNELDHGHLHGEEEQIVRIVRRRDTILTNRERDVLTLAGRGLTNKEIADRLYMSIGAVTIFLNRACTKLGARKKAYAVVLAIALREISVGDVLSLDEILHILAPLGAESIEKMAQLLDQKLGQEPIPIGS